MAGRTATLPILVLVCLVGYLGAFATCLADAQESQQPGIGQDSFPYPSFELASIVLLNPYGQPLKAQNSVISGQQVVVSSTLSAVSGQMPDRPISTTFLVQVKDEEDVVQSIAASRFEMSPLPQVNVTWTPEQSGLYSIQVFVLGNGGDGSFYLMANGRIINVFASPARVVDTPNSKLASGILVEVEKQGARQFYQDRDMFLPTQLSMTKNETADWKMVAWPSIGPNYIISKLSSLPAEQSSTIVVYDYYQALGIDSGMKNIQYDEFTKSADFPPYPTAGGRYFGFTWNQTDMHGTKVEAGEYEVQLTMPILIGDVATGDDKRVRVVLTSDPERFTLLEGPPTNLQHNLVLKQFVNQTELQTGEPYDYSLALVNTGDQEEYFSLLSDPCPWPEPGGIVYPWYFSDNPLKPGESFVITQGISESPKYPGEVYLNGSYTIAVPDEPLQGKSDNDGVRASCIALEPNPIVLKVTAPTFEGVKLVLESNKSMYSQNETVHLSLYIANNSDKPFALAEVNPSLQITASNGTTITLSWAADYFGSISVDPHSVFRLDNSYSLEWDLNDAYQIPPDPGDGQVPADTGTYDVEATFISPYLKSKTLTIIVAE